MQDVWFWNPPVEERSQTFPRYLGALAAANQNIPPQPIQSPLEKSQLIDIAGYRVVLVIPLCDLLEPCTDFGRAMMLPVLKLDLDGFQLRNHSLLRSDPPDGEGSGLVAVPTEVGEAQEREGLGFSLATLLSVSGCITPELDQSCLFWM